MSLYDDDDVQNLVPYRPYSGPLSMIGSGYGTKLPLAALAENEPSYAVVVR